MQASLCNHKQVLHLFGAEGYKYAPLVLVQGARTDSMTINATIKRLREAAGLSQSELGRRLGVSYAAVQQWESGASRPRPQRIKELAQVLGVSQAVLLGLESEVASAAAPMRSVPLISWVQAGSWEEAVDIFEPGNADHWVPVNVTTGDNAFALTVVGDSMISPYGSASYPPGTIIVVDPAVSPDPGKRVVAKHIDTGDVTFKELAQDAGVAYLKPLNPQYPALRMDSEWQVVGVVVSSIHVEK